MSNLRSFNGINSLRRLAALLMAAVMLASSAPLSALAEGEGPQPVCGMTEHVHGPTCYRPELTCGLEEADPVTETVRVFTQTFQPHQHSEACYDQNGKLSCGYVADKYYHLHNKYCKDAEGNNVCGLSFTPPHEHTDDCFTEKRTLTCGQEESEEHVHTEACYTVTRELTCKYAKIHNHSAACFTTETVNGKEVKIATCGYEQIPLFESTENSWSEKEIVTSEGHRHTDACYTVPQEPNCGIPEHTHSAACYPTAEPTEEPTAEPTEEPTAEPTAEPTEEPTAEPTAEPTEEPTAEPTAEPTEEPTAEPTAEPTEEPTAEPTAEPTEEPTPEPTAEPTEEPTAEPTAEPTEEPTPEPTAEPTEEPTPEPTAEPTEEPTAEPTAEPTEEPTPEPTAEPTEEPTPEPTAEPTEEPTPEPTAEPTEEPTAEPTAEPTEEPTVQGSVEPAYFTYWTREESVRLSDVLEALEISGEIVSAETVEDGIAAVPGQVKVLFANGEEAVITLGRETAYELTWTEETALLADVLAALDITGEAVTVAGAEETEDGWAVAVPGNLSVVFSDENAAVITLKRLVELTENVVRAERSAQTVEDLISSGALTAEQALALGLVAQIEAPEPTRETKGTRGIETTQETKGTRGVETTQETKGTRESKNTKALLAAAVEPAVSTKTEAVVLDIQLTNDALKTEDGQYLAPIRLSSPIRMVEEGCDIHSYTVQAYHIADGKATAVPVSDVVIKDGKLVSFTIMTDGFSPYVVKYTVDFEFNGRTYTMAGYGQILLSELLTALNTEFTISDVDNVTFSDASLLSLKKVERDTTIYQLYLEQFGYDGSVGSGDAIINGSGSTSFDYAVQAGDWILTSLKPFTEEHTLEISLRNGLTISVKVTDPVSDPTNGIWYLDDTNTVASGDLSYSISSAITETVQERDVSFSLTVNYELTPAAFGQIHDYVNGFPKLVYDVREIMGEAPVTISNTSGIIRQGFTTVGEYAIVNGVVTITITNLAWLQNQNGLGGHFNITINVDETRVNEEGTVQFDLPGITKEITIHVKPLEYHPTKTVSYDGQNAAEGVYLTEDNGWYYLHYTATLDNPKDASSIKFMDTLSGNQELVDTSVTIDGQSVNVTQPYTQGTTTYSFAADVPLQDGVVKQGTHTVQYTTRIEKSKVKQWIEPNIDLEVNDSDWLVNDSSVIDGPETTVKPVQPTPAPTPAPTPVPMTIDKKVNGQDNLDSVQPGATLNYEITFGQEGTDMGNKVISDYMTDNQKLTAGSVEISYDNGGNWTAMPSTGAWDGGVCYTDDGNYGAYNTDVFRYKLDPGTTGPVKVRYTTTVISVAEAARSNLFGDQWIENTAKVDNMTDVTHAKVTFPDEPGVTKTANGVKDVGTVAAGTVINYRIQYGSRDIPLAGTSIQDAMTALQDLAGDGDITVQVNGTSFTIGSAEAAAYGSGSVDWTDLNGNYGEYERNVFNFTFRNDLDPSICGPVIVTYTATVMNPIPDTMFGVKTFKNRVTVNNKSDETTGQVHTNEPETITKVIKDESGNVITEATPGQKVTYVVTIGDPREDMSGRKITDWMSSQQLLDTSTSITISSSNGHSDTIEPGETGYAWSEYNTYSPWNTYNVLWEYPVPDGWTGPLTLTYKTIIADETQAHNAGMWGVQRVKNHATTDKGGNADTDVPVDYGEPQKTHLEKAAENQTTASGDWKPGDRIKWTVTFGDSTMDMRGKVLEDNMTFLQTLDMTAGVQVTVNGVTTTLPVVTSRYNSNDPGYYGVLYPLDDHVNQNSYSPYTTVPVFRYQVDPNAADPIMGPITFTYYTDIIDQDTAWTLGINDVHWVNNHVWTDDNSDDEGGNTDFENPPDPTTQKKAYTGADDAEAETKANLHVDGEAYALGSYIYYEMTYGNDYTNLNNYWISDRMTEIQTLVSAVEYQITNDRLNIHPTEWITIPNAPTADTGTPDGVKWGYEHPTDGQYSSQNKVVFTYRLPADAGTGKLTVRYTVRVMTEAEAQANFLYGTYTDFNSFYAGGTTSTVFGPVTVNEPGKDPQKEVSPVDVDDDPATTDVVEGWKPGDELSYTLKYGYPGQWINNPSSLTNIYDSMTNMQKLQLDDTHHVTVTYYTQYYTTQDLADDTIVKQTASFDMPVDHNGVRWTPRQDNEYSASMVDVFNYTFPKEDEQKPGAAQGTPMGRIYGPITVTYKTNIISVEEAQASFIWGTAAEPTKTINNVFMNVAQTPGQVAFPPEPTHLAEIQKTAYEMYNSATGKYEPYYDYVGTYGVVDAPPAGVRSTVVESEGKVVWSIRVDMQSGSTFPLEDFKIIEEGYQFEQATGANYSNTGGSKGGTYDNDPKPVDSLFHIAEAVVTTDSGTILTPGQDYSYNEVGPYTFHFDRIDEPITITFIAEFPYLLVGSYKMKNTVKLEYYDVHNNYHYDNSENSVTGKISNAVASKTGNRVSGTDLIKWEVLLNPLQVTFPEPGANQYVQFDDYLPEGLTMVNYMDHSDTDHPSIYVESNEWSRVSKEREVTVSSNNTFSTDISSLREVNVNNLDDAQLYSYDGYWYRWNGDLERIPGGLIGVYKDYTGNVQESGMVMRRTGISGNWYKVTYYTLITSEEWNDIYSSPTGSKDYLNRAFFTNGLYSYSAEATVPVKAPSPITKGEYNGYEGDPNYSALNEIVTGGGTVEGDVYYYKIDINPNRVQLVQAVDGQKLPIKLMDYIDPKIDTDPTHIRIRTINANGTDQYRLDAETGANTFPDEDKPIVRYNDDTRMLSIDNLQDQTHYVIEYPVRLRAQYSSGDDENEFKVTNTVTMQASGTWSTTVTNTHKEQKSSFELDVPITLQKVDENDATVRLSGAVFEVYKLTTDPTTGEITDWPGTKIDIEGHPDDSASFTTGADGKITFRLHTFDELTLYYWKEIEAPTGYLLVNTPHYFIVYKEDGGNTNRLNAWAMDNLCSDANHITIASISKGTTWMVTNSKTRSIMLTKKWDADYNNTYKTRPESITVNLIQIDYLGNRRQIDSAVLYPDADGNWLAYTNYIWNGLPAHEAERPDRPYTYTVEEEYVKDYVAVYSDNQEGVTSGGITVTNRLIPSKTSIAIEKKWQNTPDADLPDHITVTLYQITTDSDGNVSAPRIATGIPNYVVTLMRDPVTNQWTYTWPNLPTKDGLGGSYTYTVQETVPEGFTVTYSDGNRGVLESTSENPLVITNTAVGSLTVTKAFVGLSAGSLTQAQKEAIQFTVTNGAGETVAEFTYADMLGGSKTIENLPAGIYTVTEADPSASAPDKYEWKSMTYSVTNGQTAVVKNGTATVNVTNEYEKKKASVQVTKAFSGVDALPSDFQITNDYNDTVFTVDGTGEAAPVTSTENGVTTYTWTIADVPLDTEITFTESGIVVDGYNVSVTANAVAQPEGTTTASASATSVENVVNSASFVNTYTPAIGSVQVTKTFSDVDALPGSFKITASWTVGETNYSEDLTVSTGAYTVEGTSYTVSAVSGDGSSGDPYTWTIGGLPLGITVTFTESGYGKAGYNCTSRVTDSAHTNVVGVTGSAEPSAAATLPGTAKVAFTNTYIPGVELPATGGPGTAAYTASGLALILGALWMLLRRRRGQN